MGDGDIRNAVLHGILRTFVVVKQFEQGFIGTVVPAHIAADIDDQVFAARGAVSRDSGPHSGDFGIGQVARRESDQIRIFVHAAVHELRIVTLHPPGIVRIAAQRLSPVGFGTGCLEVRIVEPAEVFGNGIIDVTVAGNLALQPRFQCCVLRFAARGLVRIAGIGAFHDTDGIAEIGHSVPCRGLCPGGQQAKHGRSRQRHSQQGSHRAGSYESAPRIGSSRPEGYSSAERKIFSTSSG